MTIKQQILQDLANNLWDEYIEIFPALVRFDCPKIVLNNRYTKTAGMARLTKGQCDISAKFLAKFPDEVLGQVLPHELAHFIDYNLNGWFTGKRGHGLEWQIIMEKIGKNTARCHTMVL